MLRRKRIFAMIIDHFIITLLSLMPFMIIFGPYIFITSDILFNACLILFGILSFCKDLFFVNRSFGKKIMKLEVLNQNDEPPRITILIFRNIFLILWPIELILVIKYNKRIGDILFKTKVKAL